MSWRKCRGKNVGGLNVGCDQIFMINVFFKFFFTKICNFYGNSKIEIFKCGNQIFKLMCFDMIQFNLT